MIFSKDIEAFKNMLMLKSCCSVEELARRLRIVFLITIIVSVINIFY